tara:strand:- start:28 stop:360 length:333 start_codon:yes stop_codon:yes gene_type:complete
MKKHLLTDEELIKVISKVITEQGLTSEQDEQEEELSRGELTDNIIDAYQKARVGRVERNKLKELDKFYYYAFKDGKLNERYYENNHRKHGADLPILPYNVLKVICNSNII